MATGTEHLDVTLETAGVDLSATLGLPAKPTGFVLFAHGSGSSRFSSRNRFVAGVLEEAGLATLLLDLLTPTEELEDAHTARLRFDVRLLAERLAGASDWAQRACLGSLPLGYFGSSTGAAAALIADASSPGRVQAIVSRGGRPDLAGGGLRQVKAPTLLLVGGADTEVLELNRQALARLTAPSKLQVIPGASHLFEEPGALAAVAGEASQWFRQHLRAAAVPEVSVASSS